MSVLKQSVPGGAMPAIRILKSFEFEGHSLLLVAYRDRPCVVGQQLGEAMNYVRGVELTARLTGHWAHHFKVGYHYDVLRGLDLAQFLSVIVAQDHRYPWLTKRSLPILYEPGIYQAAMMTQKSTGTRLALRLATEEAALLPMFASLRGTLVEAPATPAAPQVQPPVPPRPAETRGPSVHGIELLEVQDLGNGCQLIRARGPLARWTMERAGDDDPVFPSISMAATLGYKDLSDINELIRRLFLTETEYSRTTRGNSPADGEVVFRFIRTGGRGRPAKEYLLTRRQMLKLIKRSETERAEGLQDEIDEILRQLATEESCTAGWTCGSAGVPGDSNVPRSDANTGGIAASQHPGTNAKLNTFTKVFEGKRLTTIVYKGKPWWIAREVGAAMNYGDAGKNFVHLVMQEWAEDFDDEDRWVVQGEDLKAIKQILGEELSREVGVYYSPTLLLLSESGIYKAMILSRKPEGRRMRNWLAKDVMPEIRQTGGYQERIPQSAQSAILAELAEQQTQLTATQAGQAGVVAALAAVSAELAEQQTQLTATQAAGQAQADRLLAAIGMLDVEQRDRFLEIIGRLMEGRAVMDPELLRQKLDELEARIRDIPAQIQAAVQAQADRQLAAIGMLDVETRDRDLEMDAKLGRLKTARRPRVAKAVPDPPRVPAAPPVTLPEIAVSPTMAAAAPAAAVSPGQPLGPGQRVYAALHGLLPYLAHKYKLTSLNLEVIECAIEPLSRPVSPKQEEQFLADLQDFSQGHEFQEDIFQAHEYPRLADIQISDTVDLVSRMLIHMGVVDDDIQNIKIAAKRASGAGWSTVALQLGLDKVLLDWTRYVPSEGHAFVGQR